jgi:hypothetical protein
VTDGDSETIEVDGHRVDVVPSAAIRPLVPALPPQRMSWEVRASEDPEVIFGYIDEETEDEVYAFDPVAFEFGLGIACTSRDQAIRTLLSFAFPAGD